MIKPVTNKAPLNTPTSIEKLPLTTKVQSILRLLREEARSLKGRVSTKNLPLAERVSKSTFTK